MVLEDIKDGATKPTIPFIGETSLSIGVFVSLVIGFGLLAITRPLGENLGDMASNTVASVTGFNPQTGATNQNQAAVGGA